MNRRKKILVAVVVVIGAVFLVPVLRHYQLKAEVDRYRAELKAKGEPMDLAQVVPPAVPPELNSAESFLKAGALMHQDRTFLSSNSILGQRLVAPGKAMIQAMQPDVRDSGES